MKNSLNGRYHTRVVVNIIYSTVVACMVMVFLVTNLSMIGQYAAERGMENSLALLFYRPGTMIVLLYVLLGIGVFSVSFLQWWVYSFPPFQNFTAISCPCPF